MNMISFRSINQDYDFPGTMGAVPQGIVVIVSDDRSTIENVAPVCEFLELRLEVVSAGTDLIQVLREHRPIAVISDVDGKDQDGFHTMKVIARYNRDLPIMLLTGGDSMLMGAADAVQDMWGLASVTRTSSFPLAGQLVAFLFGAGRRTGGMRLVPI